MTDAFIELRGIRKEFAGVCALDDMSLTIRAGEIHCLAGENGSGKSTIIKVMSGVYQPDAGEIRIQGKAVHHLTPIASIDRGIQVIYQDFSLFGNLTVAENLAMNTQLRQKRRLMNWGRVRAIARDAVDRIGVDLDLDAEVGNLPTAGKQLVAIARALMSDARLIIMDEPTTALTRREVETLFRIVKDIQSRGIAVLFVSHKIREMMEISERITVMRNGSLVADGPVSDFDEASLIRHMTGLELNSKPYVWVPGDRAAEAPRLEVSGLGLSDAFEDVDLTIRAGEIVGLSGLLGSGRTELVLSLFGMIPADRGVIRVDGKEVTPRSTQQAIAAGIAYVPEDRLSEGLFLTQGIDRNILCTSYESLASGLTIDQGRADTLVDDTIKAMQIATPSGAKLVKELSGGNQQRVVLGRWLLTDARVLILNGPTVGVDVGSKAEIHHKIRDLAVEHGLAVLMISDDVLELVQNCNRIVLMHRGRLTEGLDCATTSEEAVSEKLKAFT
ncbi:MAG: sugar ABC transporter ATP-binding protein [Rhodospirillum sp.]|nr:sugar ABC transporter ATP-binding protein [Rhodospirillum sp.]MCF8490802.1 sugar ABC transporter ATP-binding protein [Rhodospirillum sp.]MCF8499863.1 sugar ABC transporter ATP-binding protein [Rhodospirillum sp.]